MMKIFKVDKLPEQKIIKQGVEILKQGGIIVYPTETCYGLGGDATNAHGVSKIIDYKSFKKGEPISIAVSSQQMAQEYVVLNETSKNIYKNLLPGPITVISNSLHQTDPRAEANNKTLGIRIPNHNLALKLIEQFGRPITATSANISGGKTPYTVDDILSQLSDKKKKLIDLIIDAGKLPRRLPSSVVDTTLNEIKILRQGEIDFSQLKIKTKITNSAQETTNLGMQLTKQNINFLKNKCLIFALQGELGAGKTQFTKGIGQALGIKETITSPTFTIIKEYEHKQGLFYHIDAWRIKTESLNQLEIDKYIKPGNILAIEWIQKGKQLIDKWGKKPKIKLILVEITHQGKTKRKIKYTS